MLPLGVPAGFQAENNCARSTLSSNPRACLVPQTRHYKSFTFAEDVLLAETEPMIRKLAEHTWTASRKEARIARTIVLKLKTSEFKILTRIHTPASPPSSCEELTEIALALRERVGLSAKQRFRLVGV